MSFLRTLAEQKDKDKDKDNDDSDDDNDNDSDDDEEEEWNSHLYFMCEKLHTGTLGTGVCCKVF